MSPPVSPRRFYLVGAVEQGEDVPFLHGDFTWTLLLVVIQGQDQLLARLIIGWCHLLLFKQSLFS